MLDKFKDIPIYKVITLTLGIIYVFGLLTLLSHLSKFGILTFDIINTRVIVAGLFPAASFLFVVFVFYVWRKIIFSSKDKMLSLEKTKAFLVATGLAIFLAYAISNSLASLFTTSLSRFQVKQSSVPLDILSDRVISWININDLIVRETIRTLLPYVLVGILVAVLVAVVLLVIFFLEKILKKIKEKTADSQLKKKLVNKKLQLTVNVILSLVLVLVCAFLIIYSYKNLSFNDKQINDYINFNKLSTNLMFSWFIFSLLPLSFYSLIFDIEKFRDKKSAFLELMDRPQLFVSGILAMILLSILIFGRVIYPSIPYRLGGGELREVNLIQDKDLLTNLNINNNDKVFLIDETPDYKFFLIKNNQNARVVQIRSEIVKYLEILNKN